MDPAALSHEQRQILTHCLARMREIEATPDPPAWRSWDCRDLAELREYGPTYSPAAWFGGGNPIPPKYATRFLRGLHALGRAGLLTTVSVGGRLRHVRLTDAGLALAEGLEAVPPTGEVTG